MYEYSYNIEKKKIINTGTTMPQITEAVGDIFSAPANSVLIRMLTTGYSPIGLYLYRLSRILCQMLATVRELGVAELPFSSNKG